MADDDPVQPEGQGGTEDASPWAEYLNRIPEEVRGDVEPIFREWDGNTTRKFQEAAEYKRSWEPLEETGVSGRDPAEVQWAMQFVDALGNPAAIKDWYSGYAQEHGLTPAETAAAQEAEWVDPSVQALVEQRLQAQLGPVSQQLADMAAWRDAQERQSREAQAAQSIRTELDGLKTKHGAEFDEALVEMLIPRYLESDPKNAVQRAFSDSQAVRSRIEKATLQGKVDQAPGAESGGTVDGSVTPAKTLAQAAEQAMEQLRAGRG